MWIAHRFTEEHRAALDWLNDNTNEQINLFGLEIELWRIGDSPIAPKFNVVSQPNDWVKQVSAGRRSASSDLTDVKRLQLEYWSEFRTYVEERDSILNPRKPFPQHWYDFAIGRSGFHLSALLHSQENRLAKLRDYLLSTTHVVGKSKARFFRAHGFDETNADLLADGLITIAQSEEVLTQSETAFGTKFVIDGMMASPSGNVIDIRTVWLYGLLRKAETNPGL